ncbi:MAG: CDP-alcohol phosphatidyltransferase family protein [Acidobacteria bacterium]|nr:CDP-alcohol phosphatidyltransferase family protein [Acidobacteriota bacterium]MBV9475152.1 CDP-alcohol phosphatidyltransferase family protein [Acidobacteriota bacterium]
MRHIPNLLTSLRLVLVPCFLVASMQRMYTLAFVLFVTAAVTDIFDGAIARRFNVRSRIGALLDPLADKTLMICGFLYYTFSSVLPRVAIPGWLTFTVFARDFLIVVFVYLLYTRIRVTRFPPSAAGKISTMVQAATLGAAIAANGFLPQVERLADVLFHVSVVTTLFSGWGYLRRASQLLTDEPLAQA